MAALGNVSFYVPKGAFFFALFGETILGKLEFIELQSIVGSVTFLCPYKKVTKENVRGKR